MKGSLSCIILLYAMSENMACKDQGLLKQYLLEIKHLF
jgi:hypothetical protein